MAAPNIVTGAVFPEQRYQLVIPVTSLANFANGDILKARIYHRFRIEDIRWRTGDKVCAGSGGTVTFTPKISSGGTITNITCGTLTIAVSNTAGAATIGGGVSLASAITGNNTGADNGALYLTASGVSAFTAGTGSGWFEIDVVNTEPGANAPTNLSAG